MELLRALDRANRFLARGDEDRWRGSHEDDLVAKVCRRVGCWEDARRAEVLEEARRLVDEMARLHRQIASVRRTHGEHWERSLLENLLREARVDSSTAAAVLDRF